jgi:hypothetical protein
VDPEPPSMEVCAVHATTARELARASVALPERRARGAARSKIMACRSVDGCIPQPLIHRSHARTLPR